MRKVKISLLTNMVTPYRIPFFKEMANNDAIDVFRVLTCVERECDRQWDLDNDSSYKVKKLGGFTLNLKSGKDARRIMHFRVGIIWELIFYRPDKLIIGDASWTSFIAAFLCILLRVPYVVWNEITTTSKISTGIVGRLRSFMYKHALHLIASCRMAKDYLMQCGVDERDISVVNNAVDNTSFLTHKDELVAQRASIRSNLGIDDDAFCFIYVGQLITRKRVIETVELLARTNKNKKVHLIVAGTGPLENELKNKAYELCFDNVSFCGFVQGKKISELYVASDSLILLSNDEPWGMVVNEALLFGCNVVATDSVAAAVEFSDVMDNKIAIIQDISLVDDLQSYCYKKEYDSFVEVNVTAKNMAKGVFECL
ncbi:glycosyltransferase family 4 protein [Vibrio cholerae]